MHLPHVGGGVTLTVRMGGAFPKARGRCVGEGNMEGLLMAGWAREGRWCAGCCPIYECCPPFRLHSSRCTEQRCLPERKSWSRWGAAASASVSSAALLPAFPLRTHQ